MPEKQTGSQTVSGIEKAVCHVHMAHKFRNVTRIIKLLTKSSMHPGHILR